MSAGVDGIEVAGRSPGRCSTSSEQPLPRSDAANPSRNHPLTPETRRYGARGALRKIRRTAATPRRARSPRRHRRPPPLFDWRCGVSAADTAYALVRGDGECTASLSYAQLAQQVRTLAAAIAARSEAGDRVLLMLPTGLGVGVRLLGLRDQRPHCRARSRSHARRAAATLGAIVDDAARALVLTLPETRLPVRSERRWPERLDVVLGDSPRRMRRMPRSAPHSSPTCRYLRLHRHAARVMISHANVMAQLRGAIERADMDALPRADLAAAVPRLRPGLGRADGLRRRRAQRPDARARLHALAAVVVADGGTAWQHAQRRAPHFAYVAVLGHWPSSPTGTPISPHCAACPAAPSRSARRDGGQARRRAGAAGRGPGVFAPAYGLAEAVLGVSAPAPSRRVRRACARSIARRCTQAARKTPEAARAAWPAARCCRACARASSIRFADPARLRGHAHRRALAAGRERRAGLLGPQRRQRGRLRRARCRRRRPLAAHR